MISPLFVIVRNFSLFNSTNIVGLSFIAILFEDKT